MSVWRIDDKCKSIFEGEPKNDTDRFQEALADDVEAKSKEMGTHSLAFWQDAVKHLSPRTPTTIVFLTDGWEEGITEQEKAQLHVVGNALAAGNVRGVYLCGVNPKIASLWTTAFKGLQKRLHVSGPVDSLDGKGMDQIEASVDAAH